jgi:toxin ParE1/3/4
MRLRLTWQADADIESILRETHFQFGRHQFDRYAKIMSTALDMLAENPHRPSVRDRSDIRKGIHSFSLRFAAGRRAAASHSIYFRISSDANGTPELVILRILHERMEPKRRLVAVLKEGDPE